MMKSKGGVPKGYQAVMPYLRVRDAVAAIKFYKKVFGAKENYRLRMAGKIGHAELTVGGSVVMLSDEFPDSKAIGPKTLKGTSVQLTAYVDDVDKLVAKAVKAGARVTRKVDDQFYGDRMGQIEDPFGHVWSINQRLVTVAPKEMQKRLNALMRGAAPASPVRARKAAGKPGKKKAATKSRASAAVKAAPARAKRTPAKPARRKASAGSRAGARKST